MIDSGNTSDASGSSGVSTDEPGHGGYVTATEALIELRRLHRFFGSTRAVNDVSFQVYGGEVFGYIGPNGAGKTTSMRILATLDMPSFGDALVDGFSVVNDSDRVRRRIGFMPDAFGTYADVNCREYLDFFARAYGLVGRERSDACKRVMGFTGLDVLADKPINGLSKGMKQRLCLGRSLVHDPKVLILDEPAAGLDPRARIELREMIVALAAEGKAILISSHILTELAEVCDSVGIIEQGQLLAVGSVAEMEERLAGKAALRIAILGGAEAAERAAKWLADQPSVTDVTVQQDAARLAAERAAKETSNDDQKAERPMTLHCRFSGTPVAQSEILAGLIGQNHRVVAFGAADRNLEEVFLNVTEGRVQ